VNARSGRGWAYAGAVLGGVVSIAANVAHSYVPGKPDPAPLAVALSIFWPVAVLVAVEITARVDWTRVGRWAVVRWIGVPLVGLMAAVVSYRHLSGLLVRYGEDPVTAAIGPLAVDGLMLMATAALIATGHGDETATSDAETCATSAEPDRLFDQADQDVTNAGHLALVTTATSDPVGHAGDQADQVADLRVDQVFHKDRSPVTSPLVSPGHTVTSRVTSDQRRGATRTATKGRSRGATKPAERAPSLTWDEALVAGRGLVSETGEVPSYRSLVALPGMGSQKARQVREALELEALTGSSA
jgi:hypothetical protein